MSSVADIRPIHKIRQTESPQNMKEYTFALGEEDTVWVRLNGVEPHNPGIRVPGWGVVPNSIVLFGGAVKLQLSLPWSLLRDGLPVTILDKHWMGGKEVGLGILDLELHRGTEG